MMSQGARCHRSTRRLIRCRGRCSSAIPILETISLVNPPTDFDGVLVNKGGEVVSLWSSFAFEAGRELQQENKGIPAELVAEMIPALTQGQPLYSFEAEFLPIPLAAASKMGLSRQWIESLEKHDPTRRQALAIHTVGGRLSRSQSTAAWRPATGRRR